MRNFLDRNKCFAAEHVMSYLRHILNQTICYSRDSTDEPNCVRGCLDADWRRNFLEPTLFHAWTRPRQLFRARTLVHTLQVGWRLASLPSSCLNRHSSYIDRSWLVMFLVPLASYVVSWAIVERPRVHILFWLSLFLTSHYFCTIFWFFFSPSPRCLLLLSILFLFTSLVEESCVYVPFPSRIHNHLLR